MGHVSHFMSSSEAISAEIPIPADRIIKELEKSAQPGIYGQVEVQLGLSEDALKGVTFLIVRRVNLRSQNKPTRIGAAEKETEGESSVRKVIGDISKMLRLRLTTVKIVGHIHDGKLNGCELVDEERVV